MKTVSINIGTATGPLDGYVKRRFEFKLCEEHAAAVARVQRHLMSIRPNGLQEVTPIDAIRHIIATLAEAIKS